MSDHFSLYEDDLNLKLNRLNQIVGSFQNLSKEKKESALSEASGLLKDCERLLSQMNSECNTVSNNKSDAISIKVQEN